MRHILKLHRDLDANSLPQADHDYTIETFDPAIHKQQWLDLNNLIFSHHPDQGNWAMQDLDNRMSEPWLDEKGFFLATENGTIEGFVWTKLGTKTTDMNIYCSCATEVVIAPDLLKQLCSGENATWVLCEVLE